MIVQAIPRYSAKPVKLEIVNGRMKTAVGMTTNRLLKPRQFFFKKPFVNASTSPAVKNAKVLSRKILDWIGFWNTGLPKIVPLPMNSRMIARRIQNPQATALSKNSSPYSFSILPDSACRAHKSPTIKLISHVPTDSERPR